MRYLCGIAFVMLTTLSAQTGTPVIENERVRVWDITISPEKPLALDHPAFDFVAMFPESAKAVYGHQGIPFKEGAASGSPARVVLVELKNNPKPLYPNKTSYPAAFPRPGSKKVLENERIVVWSYTWAPKAPTPMHFHDKDVVVVFRHDGALQSTEPNGAKTVNDYKAGTIRFNLGNRTHSEELIKGQQSAMMMELK